MLTPPIPVVLPLLMAAVLAVFRRLPRPAAIFLAMATTVAVGCVAVALLNYSRAEPLIVYWFSAAPRQAGEAPGFGFTIDPAGAMLILLGSILATAALGLSAGARDDSLILLFLAAMNGCAATGDLASLFVFFEVMSAAAWALCRHTRRRFAWWTTAGGALVLLGSVMVYGRASVLNLAQIGRTLAGQGDIMMAVAFTLIACGFCLQAVVVLVGALPAERLAATPLLGGLMGEIALYCATRVYWTIFSGAIAPGHVRGVFEVLGAGLAIAGALLCFRAQALKRLLTYCTVAQAGVLLLGIGLLSPQALAGAEIYVMGYSLLMGGLLLSGRIETGHTLFPALVAVGAAGLAGIPPFATFRGAMMLGGAAQAASAVWIEWLVFAVSAAMAGTLFRFAARAFQARRRAAPLRTATAIPAMALIVVAGLAGLAPRLTGAALAAAIHVEDRDGYASRVLDHLAPYPAAVGDQPVMAGDLARGFGSLLTAVVVGVAGRRIRL